MKLLKSEFYGYKLLLFFLLFIFKKIGLAFRARSVKNKSQRTTKPTIRLVRPANVYGKGSRLSLFG